MAQGCSIIASYLYNADYHSSIFEEFVFETSKGRARRRILVETFSWPNSLLLNFSQEGWHDDLLHWWFSYNPHTTVARFREIQPIHEHTIKDFTHFSISEGDDTTDHVHQLKPWATLITQIIVLLKDGTRRSKWISSQQSKPRKSRIMSLTCTTNNYGRVFGLISGKRDRSELDAQ